MTTAEMVAEARKKSRSDDMAYTDEEVEDYLAFGVKEFCDLTNSTFSLSTIPFDYQDAVVYYAAHIMAENNFEYPISERLYARFRSRTLLYKMNENNKDSSVGFPDVDASDWYTGNMPFGGEVT